tara:strand:- start:168 stop:626 length:459 start_codon:yes stop_codon:yes gene_type:complete
LKKIVPYILVAIFFNGCTINTEYYLRNLTDQEIEITFTSNINDEIDFLEEKPNFYYKNEIKAISKKLSKELDIELEPLVLSSDSLIVNVPPTSTLKFDTDFFNFVSYYFSSMSFKIRGEKIEVLFSPHINSEYPIEKQKIDRGTYAAYLDIK